MPKTRFEVTAPQARAVFVAGDFNQWDPAARRMKRAADGSGQFVGVVDLEPGRYEYKYVVDGEWVCCPKAPRTANPYGSENSVVEVPPAGRRGGAR